MRARRARLEALEAARAVRQPRPAHLPPSPGVGDLRGKTAAQLEALALTAGLPVGDLAGQPAAQLARLYFEGWPK